MSLKTARFVVVQFYVRLAAQDIILMQVDVHQLQL